MTELRRMLWRYEAQQLHRESLEAFFSEEIALLIEQYRGEEPAWSHIGTPEFAMCVEFDDFVNKARTQMRAGQFNHCYKCLKSAHGVWKKLKLANSAAQQLALAGNALSQISEVVCSPELRGLMSIRTIERLTDKAKELFASEKYRQSQFIALMSLREAERFSRISWGEDDLLRISSRITKMRDVSQLAIRYAPNMLEGTFISVALMALETIVKQGKLILVECLIEDLEKLAAPLTTFFIEITRQCDSVFALTRLQTIEEMVARSGISKSFSWKAATEQLLHDEIKRIVARG